MPVVIPGAQIGDNVEVLYAGGGGGVAGVVDNVDDGAGYMVILDNGTTPISVKIDNIGSILNLGPAMAARAPDSPAVKFGRFRFDGDGRRQWIPDLLAA